MTDDTPMAPKSAARELVEEVDGFGNVLRIVTRGVMRAENLRHRMVAVVVRRSDGRIVVHQRAAWKDVHPSKWDVAFGGVPEVGEANVEAALRELREEAGIEASLGQLSDLGTLESSDDYTRWIGRFYLLTDDRSLRPADGEVAALSEIALTDIAAWAAANSLCDDTLEVVLPMVVSALSA